MWLLLTSLLLLGVGCSAFQCSTSPFSDQTAEYYVCPNDNDKTYNDDKHTDGCDYMSTLPLSHCDGLDQQKTVPLCWKIQDAASGTVKVTFPLLSQRCNFTGYDLTLMVHEAQHCPTNTDEFAKHSKREVNIRNCLQPACRSQCSQRGEVVFRHVFTACYQLYVTPKRYLQAYQDLDSSTVYISTQYTKTPISTLHSPIIYLDWNSASGSEVRVLVNYLDMNRVFYTRLQLINLTPPDGAGAAPTQVFLNTSGSVGSPDILCHSESSGSETVAPTCSYQGDSVVKCRFSSLKPGNYCVRIQFNDDRCVADSVWSEYNNYSTCTWESFQQFLSAEQRAVEVIGDPHNATINPVMLIFLAFVIIACVVTALVAYQHLVPGSRGAFPHMPHKTLQVSEPPVVLLLYTRDCLPFMQAVAQLRMLMRRVYNCQVLDCWEDSQFGAVAQNPGRWFISHLSSPRVCCVLVTSPASVVQEASLVFGTNVHYRLPKAFDSVPLSALTTLHENNNHDVYTRLFIVRLDTGMEGTFPGIRTYLNSNSSYVLPLHLNRLMATLYNLDSTTCTIATDGQSDVALLSELITEYRSYLRDNPRYLDSLMVSETHNSVLHVLQNSLRNQ